MVFIFLLKGVLPVAFEGKSIILSIGNRGTRDQDKMPAVKDTSGLPTS